jgi:hypothetical protein
MTSHAHLPAPAPTPGTTATAAALALVNAVTLLVSALWILGATLLGTQYSVDYDGERTGFTALACVAAANLLLGSSALIAGVLTLLRSPAGRVIAVPAAAIAGCAAGVFVAWQPRVWFVVIPFSVPLIAASAIAWLSPTSRWLREVRPG